MLIAAPPEHEPPAIPWVADMERSFHYAYAATRKALKVGATGCTSAGCSRDVRRPFQSSGNVASGADRQAAGREPGRLGVAGSMRLAATRLTIGSDEELHIALANASESFTVLFTEVPLAATGG